MLWASERLGSARRLVQRYRRYAGSLAGKLIAVKDNIVSSNCLTTASSKTLSNHTAPYTATVVSLLRQNGADITTKTALDEFGMGSHSQTAYPDPVVSPYRRNGIPLSPGGSSGGSAVAVANGECWAALGTDTGGSVRLPAAYTGTVGFKPSYALLSRWGVIQYANSLDTVGIIARSVSDVRSVFGSLNHHDGRDPTSLSQPLRQRVAAQRTLHANKLRIGIPLEYSISELSSAVRATWTRSLSQLQELGHTIVPINLPTTRQALSAYYVLAPAEASSNLAKYDGIRFGYRTFGPDASPKEGLPLYARTRGEGFGEEVQRRILLGAYTLNSEALDNYFIQAQKVRRLVQQDFDRVFSRPNPLHEVDEPVSGEGVDVLVVPTAPTLPPTIEELKRLSPVESYMNDVFTVPASLAGLPAISVPVKLSEGQRPSTDNRDVQSVGMQVIGQFGDDEGVLRAAEMVAGIQS